MTYSKLSWLFNAALAFTLVGCGSDDSGDSGDDDGSSGGSTNSVSNGGSGGTSAGGTGGTSAGGTGGTSAGGTGGGTTGGGTTSGVNPCSPLDNDDTSEECTAYRDCSLNECESEFEECMGPNVASGDYSGGVCEAYFDCAADCQSGNQCDIQCLGDCLAESEDCETCLTASSACASEACPDDYEACQENQGTSTSVSSTGSTTGGGGGTCMDLEACCNSLEGDDQTECFDGLDGIEQGGGGDAICGALLSVYQAGGQCSS